jgi:hypothetical protein
MFVVVLKTLPITIMNDPNIRIINSTQYAVHGTILLVGNFEQVDYHAGYGDTYTYPNPNNYLVNRIENASDFPDLGHFNRRRFTTIRMQ